MALGLHTTIEIEGGYGPNITVAWARGGVVITFAKLSSDGPGVKQIDYQLTLKMTAHHAGELSKQLASVLATLAKGGGE